MSKVIGIITARMGSTRFPGKVMKKIMGKSVFAYHVERLRYVDGIDGIFLATSKNLNNKELITEAERLGCGWYAGEEEDIVERHIKLCEQESADAIIRMPCDSPIFDIDSTCTLIRRFKKEYQDYIYVSNMITTCGTMVELISYKTLLEIHKYYQGSALSIFILENMKKFKTLGIKAKDSLCRPEYRLTIDYDVDLELISQIYEALYKGKPLVLDEVYQWLDTNLQVAKLNENVRQSDINLYATKLQRNRK